MGFDNDKIANKHNQCRGVVFGAPFFVGNKERWFIDSSHTVLETGQVIANFVTTKKAPVRIQQI